MKKIILLILVVFLMGCSRYDAKLEIVSLRMTPEVSGSFYLGCGNIETIQYYFSYVKLKEGTYKLIKVPIKKTIIVEEENEPYLRMQGLSIDRNILNNKMRLVKETEEFGNSQEYEFHVPKNTIIKEFKL